MLAPRIKEITSYFAELVGVEAMKSLPDGVVSTEEITRSSRAFMEMATDTILSNEGTVECYRGDMIVAHWNAVEDQEDHAILGCNCALEQLEALAQVNAELPPGAGMRMRIGISTGMAIVGNVGSNLQMHFTTKGETVDLGALLEKANEKYSTSILISERTYEQLGGGFVTKELGHIRVKGLNRRASIYELVGVNHK